MQPLSNLIPLDFANLEMLGTKLLTISDLPTTKEYERVTVIKLANPAKVQKGLMKPEVTIAEVAILTFGGGGGGGGSCQERLSCTFIPISLYSCSHMSTQAPAVVFKVWRKHHPH